MLIVSQDKEAIVSYENVEVLGIGNPLENDNGLFAIIANAITDNQYMLGEYKTKERAKEVLQAIIKEYKKVLTTFNRGTGQQRFYDLPKVYYMPEE